MSCSIHPFCPSHSAIFVDKGFTSENTRDIGILVDFNLDSKAGLAISKVIQGLHKEYSSIPGSQVRSPIHYEMMDRFVKGYNACLPMALHLSEGFDYELDKLIDVKPVLKISDFNITDDGVRVSNKSVYKPTIILKSRGISVGESIINICYHIQIQMFYRV